MVSLPQQHTVVLATKLTQPRLPTTLVTRDRLTVELNSVLSHRLTLVSASAGWGKTTLLASWLRQQGSEGGRQGAGAASMTPQSATPDPSRIWLSLDELDDAPTRFWIALITAFRTRVPDVGALALAMLDSPEPASLTAVLTALLNDLVSAPAPAPLVLVVREETLSATSVLGTLYFRAASTVLRIYLSSLKR